MIKVAERTTKGNTPFNQKACYASRLYSWKETQTGFTQFYERPLGRLQLARPTASAKAMPLGMEMRDVIEQMQMMRGDFRVWRKPDGTGIVIRSGEPIEVNPTNNAANSLPVSNLVDALRNVKVATQTVGKYPDESKIVLLDKLVNLGVQRIIPLGSKSIFMEGSPHDAMLPLSCFSH